MNENKPGYKTTEFWLANAAYVVQALVASGAIGEGMIMQGLGVVAMALTSMGYSWSRGQAKSIVK